MITVIFFLMLALFLIVGLYVAKYVKDPAGFYLMHRQAPTLLIVGTTVASVISGLTFLGTAAIWYKNGPIEPSMFGAWVGCWTGLALGMLYPVRRFRSHRIVTIQDYIEKRYDSKVVRILATIVVLAALIGAAQAQMMASSVLLSMLTNISYQTYVVITSIAVLIFCSLGGQYGVTVTDTMMFLTTILIMLAVPSFLSAAGGLKAITEVLPKTYPGFWSIHGMSNSPLSIGLATFVIWLIFPQVSPFFAARGFSAKNDLTLLRATPISVFFYIGIPMMVLAIAIPSLRLLLPDVKPAEQVFIQGLMKYTPPVIAGIAAGGIFGAIVSTIDSILLYVGFGLSRDIYKSIINPNASDRTELIVARISQFVGVLAAAILSLRGPGGLWWVSTYANGIIVSGWAIVIFGGFWCRWATKEGALAAVVLGPLAYIVVSMFKIMPQINPIFWGLGFSIAGYLIVSRLTKPSQRAVEFFDESARTNAASEFIDKAEEEGKLDQLVRDAIATKKIAWGMCLVALLYFGYYLVSIGLRVRG
ncbi:MAG TPA: sodium:solute symporter family protein [Firmicutes bacterium]|nr:sodium:solute symporter family protein [Bacillota bacterium]